MKPVVRLSVYTVLLVLTVVFFIRFRAADRRDVARAEERKLADFGDAATRDGAAPSTNSDSGLALATNGVPGTNTTVADGGTVKGANAVGLSTNQAGGTASKPGGSNTKSAEAATINDRATAITDLSLFLGTLVVLGILGAWDVSQLLGGRAGQAVMAENYLPPTDPEYEAAEAEWSKGNHLDALNMMRAYLKRNPSEQHVAIRIAEIYEKDLNNYLAAALELEEVLQRKLPREKWGWTAIRLVNIYSGKLNQTDKAMATLQRIVNDYPETAAAKKARQRLGLPEDAPAPVPAQDAEVDSPAPQRSAPKSAEPDNPALPKGFRAKK